MKRALILFAMAYAVALAGGTVAHRLWLQGNRYAQPHYAIAEQLALTGSFSRSYAASDGEGHAVEAVRPTMVSEPLYPIWLAAIFRLEGLDSPRHVPYQAALHAGTVVLTHEIARSLLPGGWALASAALVLLDPSLLSALGQYYAETLSAFLTALAFWLAGLRRPRSAAAKGFLLGLAGGLLFLSRSQMVLVTGTTLLLLAPRAIPRLGARRVAIFIGLFVVGAALPLSPWAYRNWSVFGAPQVTPSRSWQALCDKAIVTTYSAQEVAAFPFYRYSPRLAQYLFPEIDYERPGGLRFACMAVAGPTFSRYGNDLEMDRAVGSEVRRMVLAHPVRYALALPLSLPAFLAFEHEAMLYLDEPLIRSLGERPALALNVLLRIYSLVVLGLMGLGLWRGLTPPDPSSRLLVAALVAFFATHMLSSIEYRYLLTVTPLVFPAAALGLRYLYVGRRANASLREIAQGSQPVNHQK